MVILNRYKYIIVTVLMIISILSINVIKPKAELIDSINLINNGNFGNGTTGWYASNSNLSVNNNILSIDGNGTSNYTVLYKTFPSGFEVGTKIYIRLKVRTISSKCLSIGVYLRERSSPIKNTYVDNVQTPVQNQWYEFKGIVTISSKVRTDLYISAKYESNEDSLGQVHQVDCNYGVMAINLTATYGAGNEPNLMDCNVFIVNILKV